MTTPAEFRECFKAFASDEAFFKFVRATYRNFSRTRRLRFWQEDLLESFRTAYPEITLSTEKILESLKICELHEMELRPVEVPVFRGCLDYAPEYVNEMASTFPHSTLEQVMVSESHADNSCTIWVCSTCDEVRESSRWRRNA